MNKKFFANFIVASVASMLFFGTACANEEAQSDKDLKSTLSKKSSSSKSKDSTLKEKKLLVSNLYSAASPIKMLVELCVFDQGAEAVENCTTGKKASDFGSMGWDLSATPQSYETEYVESIEVKNGVITVKAKSKGLLNGGIITFSRNFKEEPNSEWAASEELSFKE